MFASWRAQGESVVLASLHGHESGKRRVHKQQDISTDTVAGMSALVGNGINVQLLVARRIPATLTAGPVSVNGEALLLVERPKKNATVMVLGAGRLSIEGKDVAIDSRDLTFDLEQAEPDGGALTVVNAVPIRRPLDPPTIGPAANTFTDKTTVTLTTTSPDAEVRYTTEAPASRMDAFLREARRAREGAITLTDAAERLAVREEEGADWKVYTGPFEISEDTCVRARTFRKGVKYVPAFRTAGTEVSAISYGFFHKRDAKPSLRQQPRLEPGLSYEYLEGRWFALWSHTDVLPAKKTGATTKLLDVAMRETDDPFAVRYKGYIEIPRDGVYTFYGPNEFINNTCEPGYDLRVYIDGEEWDLGQT